MKKLLLVLLVLVSGTVLIGCNGVVPPSDTIPPVITLLGENPLYLNVGDDYVEPGAIALDDKDGDISHKIVIGGDVVDTSNPGTYIVTYNVVDRAGNAANEVTRIVNVGVSADKFLGLWFNVDENTNAITKVLIEKRGSNLAIEMWGKCHPVDCYWGERLVEISDVLDGIIEIIWLPGFAEKTQELMLLDDNNLRVTTFVHFIDGSGRPDYVTIDYFKK